MKCDKAMPTKCMDTACQEVLPMSSPMLPAAQIDR